jgi:magnesium transporter
MLRSYLLQDGRVTPGEGPDCPIAFYIKPDEDETRHLIEHLQIDEHTLSSAQDPDELPRLEFEPNHTAIILKRPRNYSADEEFPLKVSSLGIFLFRDRVVLVAGETDDLFDGRPFARIRSVTHFALRVIYQSITHFLGHLRAINMISDDLEDKLRTSMENRYLLNLFALGKSLVYYLNAIYANGVLIEKLKNNAAKIGFTPEEVEVLDDMYVDNNQCYRQAEIYSNVLSGLMDARASIVNNNLNVLMKTLNIITIGIMVPNLVVGVFSMNVDFPLKDSPHAFLYIMGLSLLSCAIVLLIWRYKRL